MSKSKIILIIVIAAAVIVGLLYYYQSQGFIKVFPNAQDREISRVLDYDEEKFSSPEGLSQVEYDTKLQELKDLRDEVKNNTEDANLWLRFGNGLAYFSDHEGAVSAWKQTLRLQPVNFIAAGNIGFSSQYFIKDYPQSEKYYRQALDADPTLTTAYQGLTDLYRYNWTEKRGELEPLLVEAANNDPENATAYLRLLIETQLEDGRVEEARGYLGQLEQQDPAVAQELRESHEELQ